SIDGLIVELQIVPDDKYGVTRSINNITEGLRNTERAIRDMEENMASHMSPASSRLVAKSQKTIVLVREYRKALHDYAADITGVNVLMDPRALEQHKPPSPQDIQHMSQALARDYFGRRSKGLEQMQALASFVPAPKCHL